MSQSQIPQQVQYNGQTYNLRVCNNCEKAGVPDKLIFFINKGVKPDGKTDWELRNPDTTIHQHIRKPGVGGYSSPPPAITDVLVLPLVLANQPAAAKENQTAIQGMLASGFEIAVQKDTHCPQIEFDPITGSPLLIMFKRK